MLQQNEDGEDEFVDSNTDSDDGDDTAGVWRAKRRSSSDANSSDGAGPAVTTAPRQGGKSSQGGADDGDTSESDDSDVRCDVPSFCFV